MLALPFADRILAATVTFIPLTWGPSPDKTYKGKYNETLRASSWRGELAFEINVALSSPVRLLVMFFPYLGDQAKPKSLNAVVVLLFFLSSL